MHVVVTGATGWLGSEGVKGSALAERQPRGKQHEDHAGGAVHPLDNAFTSQEPGKRPRGTDQCE